MTSTTLASSRRVLEIRRDFAPKWPVVALLVALLAAPIAARAAPLDLSLHSFYDPNQAPAQRTQNGSYKVLMSELAFVLGPRVSGPAQSLGSLGMEAAYELSFAQTNAKADYWRDSVAKPEPWVSTGQLHVRKGLPYAMQIGGTLTHLFDSNMWVMGMDLNLSLIDGFVNVPDVAVRAVLQTMVGNQDISMLMVGADFVISKSFGIAGLMSLQPWASYSFLFSQVTTKQIEVYSDQVTLEPDLMLLNRVDNYSHRAAFGLRVVVTRISIGGEYLRSFSDGLSMFTAKIGADF